MSKMISVVIPSYGGGKYLERAVNSVLNQSYSPIEVIVVDDNGIGTPAQMETKRIMEKFLDFDNVFYICHDTNKNGSAARNTGVRFAHGEFISLLDDDDEYTEHNLEAQYEVLEKLPLDYAMTYCSNEKYLNGIKISETHVIQSGSLLYDVLMHKVVIGSDSLLIRKTVWEQLGGFDESFRRHQDWEFTARVAADFQIQAVDHIGFHYHIEQRNTPHDVDTAKRYRLHYLERMKPYIDRLNKRQQKDVFVSNRMDVAIQYLKVRNLKGFVAEWKEIKPGYRGIIHLIMRMWNIVKRRKVMVGRCIAK